jgi:hypothetical protein
LPFFGHEQPPELVVHIVLRQRCARPESVSFLAI